MDKLILSKSNFSFLEISLIIFFSPYVLFSQMYKMVLLAGSIIYILLYILSILNIYFYTIKNKLNTCAKIVLLLSCIYLVLYMNIKIEIKGMYYYVIIFLIILKFILILLRGYLRPPSSP